MKISDLSRQSGVPLATLKYYLREGLLPPGASTGPNQARYGEEHLRRLRLIRMLQEVGGLSLAAIKEVVSRIDSYEPQTLDVLQSAVDALAVRSPEQQQGEATREWQEAAREVDAFLDQVGWPTRATSTARKQLVDVLIQLRQLYPGLPVTAYFPYVRAAGEVAQEEVAHIMEALQADPSEALEAVVLGTVLWEPVFTALRRIAHEQLSRRVLGSAQSQKPRPEGQGQGAQEQA